MKVNFQDKYETDLYLDGANGVGADKIKILSKKINDLFSQSQTRLKIHLFNESQDKDDILNHLVSEKFLSLNFKLISITTSTKKVWS